MNRLLALPAVLVFTLAGCRSPRLDRPANRAPMTAESLQLTLETDTATYRRGQPIEMIVRLTNSSSRDTVLEFSSGQRYDFQIADTTGNTVWTWSADKSFMQALGSERLASGESLEFRERFTGQLRPGKYAVSGSITVMRSPIRTTTSITVR